MSKNSPATKAKKHANYDHTSVALEGFAQDHELELQIFGEGIHWRITGDWAVLDCWPTTGKYWVKQLPLKFEWLRKGNLPWDYNKLDEFLRYLFVKEDK
jgi:hypothetical protein